MKKLLFKLFGETNIFFWLLGALIALKLSIIIGIIYVTYHFITKFW
jgi:hypothetical protein